MSLGMTDNFFILTTWLFFLYVRTYLVNYSETRNKNQGKSLQLVLQLRQLCFLPKSLWGTVGRRKQISLGTAFPPIETSGLKFNQDPLVALKYHSFPLSLSTHFSKLSPVCFCGV